MFEQHYLGNKKPTFLACNTEEVHVAILNLQKLTIFFRTTRSTLPNL